MGKSTFYYLCEKDNGFFMEGKNTRMRLASRILVQFNRISSITSHSIAFL